VLPIPELLGPKEKGYAVDTSSFMQIHRDYTLDRAEMIWVGIIGLISTGRLKSVAIVLDELKRNDPSAFAQLQPHRRALVVPVTPLFQAAGTVSRECQPVARPRGLKDRADPWVIALAMVRDLTVVCDEGKAATKMPACCQHLGVKCINLAGLIAAEGL
jgi:hypothetical protein